MTDCPGSVKVIDNIEVSLLTGEKQADLVVGCTGGGAHVVRQTVVCAGHLRAAALSLLASLFCPVPGEVTQAKEGAVARSGELAF